MAKEVITRITDDLSGEPDAETVSFALQGTSYTIDLAAKNLEKLTKALQPFIDKAARVRSGVAAPSRRTAKRGERDFDLVQLREWAGKNKVTIPARGRIPASIVEQYKAAGGR